MFDTTAGTSRGRSVVRAARASLEAGSVVDDLGPVYHPPDLGELAAYARKRFR